MQEVRLFFAKQDRGVYISHLDMVRSVARGLSRAKIKVKYTQGFNPIPYLVFGQPLSLGYAGAREVCDFTIISDDIKVKDVAPILASFMPEALQPIESIAPKSKIGAIAKAEYTVKLKSVTSISQAEMADFLGSSEIIVLKKTKRGEAMTNIVPFIHKIEMADNMTIKCILSASSGESLNPSYLINALNQQFATAGFGWEEITRERLLLADGSDFS